MEFEVTNALRDLDVATPSYLMEEIFHHGDLKVRLEAAKVLTQLDPEKRTGRVLQAMFRLA